ELEFTAETPVTGDITVYAKWTGEHYTVTFKWWAGETKEVQLVYPQTLSSSEIPQVGTRTHYTASDNLWYYTNGTYRTPLSEETVITGNITATPNWVGNSYTVTFNNNDGQSNDPTRVNAKYPNDSPEANPMVRLSPNEIPTVSWENYIFDGWLYDDGSQTFSTDTVINSDMDVYAYWMGLNAAVVKYGALSNNTITDRSMDAVNKTYSITLKVPSFVTLGTDTVSAVVTPTSNGGSISSTTKTVTSTAANSFNVTSPVTGKSYTYKVTVDKKTDSDTKIAEGGEITYPSSGSGANKTWDEVHTFNYSSGSGDQTSYTFKITRRPTDLTGKVLIVAGGGGGGGMGNNDGGGGGGAGGVLYTKSEIDMPALNTVVTVKVGNGGAGGSGSGNGSRGLDGKASSFGSVTAAGGGGGGGGNSSGNGPGNNGGSGGGGGAGSGETTYSGGSTSGSTNSADYTPYGNDGGYSDAGVGGGGGGGAGSHGINAGGDNGKSDGSDKGHGGNGISFTDISGSDVYAKGGGGGHMVSTQTNNYGDGGLGGSSGNGNAGKAGIVIVRITLSE
ncbi:MAG: InlB B-repeat-containing protein, partial [Spirochaetaceae bacterium]|nr:InlB B-repeat-containing protein [Spirochaetaceae bacterium]